MKADSLIQTMDYCWVVSDKKLKDSGLTKGDMVLVTGTKVVPASRKDLYLQRVLVVVVLVKDDKVLLPNEENEHKAYLVDPRNLEKVDEEVSKCVEENLKKQYQTTTHHQV